MARSWLLAALLAFLFVQMDVLAVYESYSGCPDPRAQELREYKAFHAAKRLAPDAKYLVFYCPPQGCAGVGNRVRGILWMLRVALAYQRVLIFHWREPAELTNFLSPNEIDWTTTGLDMSVIDKNNDIDIMHFFDAVYRANYTAAVHFNGTKSLRHTTNEHHNVAMLGVPNMGPHPMHEGACMFNFLFKPNPIVEQRANAHLSAIYGRPDPEYVAWHWRHGDADGGKEQPVLLSHLARTLQTARDLAKQANINLDVAPILLITDFNIMRKMVVDGHFRGVATPNITARHIEDGIAHGQQHNVTQTVADAQLDSYRDIFIDLYLLSRSRCIIMSSSSFTNAAMFWGGPRLQSCAAGMHGRRLARMARV